MSNIKIKRGDKVVVIAGKDSGKQGKVLHVDRKNSRVFVEGVAMVTKHSKPSAGQPGGINHLEAAIHVSNVMYLHGGKPSRIGYKLEESTKDGKKVITKKRIAKITGDVID